MHILTFYNNKKTEIQGRLPIKKYIGLQKPLQPDYPHLPMETKRPSNSNEILFPEKNPVTVGGFLSSHTKEPLVRKSQQ